MFDIAFVVFGATLLGLVLGLYNSFVVHNEPLNLHRLLCPKQWYTCVPYLTFAVFFALIFGIVSLAFLVNKTEVLVIALIGPALVFLGSIYDHIFGSHRYCDKQWFNCPSQTFLAFLALIVCTLIVYVYTLV